MIEANYQFSAKMLTEAVKQHSDSLVISAYGALMPLGILAMSADGETEKELFDTLGFKFRDTLLNAMAAVHKALNQAEETQIKAASRIYIPKKYRVNRSIRRISSALGNDVKRIDFGGPKAVAIINSWVSNKTNHKIENLLLADEINKDTKVVLVNAIYFWGRWLHPFDSNNTNFGTFYAYETNSTDKEDYTSINEVSYMSQQSRFGYYRDEELQAKILEMRYIETTAKTSFVIILPHSVNGLSCLLDKIKDASVLKKSLDRIAIEEVEVEIPKFTIETKTDLKECLTEMGITKLFDSSAELPRLLDTAKQPRQKIKREILEMMGPDEILMKLMKGFARNRRANRKELNPHVHITNAVQKAYISVYEGGTEAAAANSFVEATSSGNVPEHVKSFKADHPFVFLIREVILLWATMAGADEDGEALQLVRAANDQLSMKMLLEATKEPVNLGLSAYSVFTPLSLISLIADGPTHEEILTAVGFQNDLSLISSMTIENSHLHTADGIYMKTANKVFLPDSVDVDQEFAIKNNIITDLQEYDHKKPVLTVANINKWAADQTDNEIDYILSGSDVDKNSNVIIASVHYFKGEWETGFEEYNTKNGTFHVTEAEQTEVMYMFQGNRFKYSKNDELTAQILELPYVNNVASLVIILPNEINGLEALKDKIKDPLVLRNAISNLSEVTVGVTIPKFVIETTLDLQDILQKIGITTLFTPGANLQKLLKQSGSTTANVSESVENSTNTNLSKAEDITRRAYHIEKLPKLFHKMKKKQLVKENPRNPTKAEENVVNTSTDPHKAVEEMNTNLFVTKAIQKCIISIDEAGKKVAEAPVLGEDEEVAYKLNFKADHPFVFLIKQGDLILFTGVYKS